MKKRLITLAVLTSLLSFDSCKKGCTNPLAHNYNKKKKKDNGTCKVYSSVKLSSIDISTIPEYNRNGVIWDGGNGNDLDNDNTLPDLYVRFQAESGYAYVPTTFMPTVLPSNVNKTQTLTPISISDWEDKSFWAYFYEIDLSGSARELIDSVEIQPYIEGASKRFRDTVEITKGEITFTANMQWQD